MSASSQHSVRRLNAKTGEWEDMQRPSPPPHWPWLQSLVDWLWRFPFDDLAKPLVVLAVLIALWLTRSFWA